MVKYIFLINFIFSNIFLFSDAAVKDNKAEEYFNKGVVYYNSSNFNSAIREFSRAIEIDPEYIEAYMERGNSYDNTGDADKALLDYRKAGELDKKFLRFAYGYECIVNLEKYDEGIAALTECINSGINTIIAYCIIGNAYVDKEEYGRAIQNYNKALKINPDFFQAYFSRGTAYFNQENYDSAIEDYERASKLCPDYILSFYYLGILYHLKGDEKKSEGMFQIYRSGIAGNKI